MSLRELDRRVVPGWSAGLRRGLDTAQRGLGRLQRGGHAVRRAVLAPPPPTGRFAALRRLDDRFASSGPLGMVREVPQIGLLVAAAVFVSGAGVALARSGPHPPAAVPAVAVPAPSVLLGPAFGQTADRYVDQSRARAVTLSAQSPESQYVALVSFAIYVTPAQVRTLMGPLRVRRVYLRSRVTGALPEILPVPVEDVLVDLRRTYAALAVRKGAEQREFRKLAESISPQTKDEKQFKTFYLAAAVAAGKEAADYRAGCACVFAAVVSGPARALAELSVLQGVRAVELAQQGADVATLRVNPLLPEVRGVVKPIRTNGTGNGA